MNGFGIYVKNTLLEKKHHDQMGEAVWLYMWLLDKMTSISEDGVGKVLGGKPIKHADFEDNLGIARSSYIRYVKRLEEHGYISTTRTPYGLVFKVYKAEKIFGKAVDKPKKRCCRFGTSVSQSGTSLYQSGTSNIRQYRDNTVDKKKLNKEKETRVSDSSTTTSDVRGTHSPAKERIREIIETRGVKALAK